MPFRYATRMAELIDTLIDILRIDGERWQAIATGLDRALLARSPAPGEWSALECLGHAADTEAFAFAARVRAIMDGRPDLPGYDSSVQGTPVTPETDPGTVAGRLAAQRRDILAVLAAVTDGDLDRTSRHPKLGQVTLRELLNEWAAHDLMHIVQAERAVMQPFIARTGPWRPSFADHDAEAPKAAG
jgi:hypothetical protein